MMTWVYSLMWSVHDDMGLQFNVVRISVFIQNAQPYSCTSVPHMMTWVYSLMWSVHDDMGLQFNVVRT